MKDDYAADIEPYISGKAKTCSYCNRIESLILLEGDHSYITLALGQIVEGYTQVCSKKHRTSAAGLHPYEVEEFAYMKALVREAYAEIYGNKGIAFEHGEAGSCLWGIETEKNLKNLCHHTHIHFVPVEIDIRDQISAYAPQYYTVTNLEELKEVRTNILEGKPYLYFEDENEVGYIYPVDNIVVPRQFLRSCVAKALGLEERADWIRYPGVEHFNEGKNKLMPFLQRKHLERVK